MVSLFAVILSRSPSTRVFIYASIVLSAITLLLVLLVLNGRCNHAVVITDFIVALCILLSAKEN